MVNVTENGICGKRAIVRNEKKFYTIVRGRWDKIGWRRTTSSIFRSMIRNSP